MTGLTPARLLAPTALVVAALALIVVVSSGGGGDGSSPAGDAKPKATATPTAKPSARKKRSGGGAQKKTYTVKPGDSPSSIAAAEGVTVDELLQANPDADPTALSVGDELEVPGG